ncbi:MAG: proline dehydrogenase family protein, partial [Burkholderiaceae bacterium]
MSAVPQSAPSAPDAGTPFAAFLDEVAPPRVPLREAIAAAARRDECEAVQWLLAQARDTPCDAGAVAAMARTLVGQVRARRAGGIDALLREYALSSQEGVALMCLAEALLRIPDRATADRLIADKLGRADWRRHLGASPSLFANAATWGLLIAGRLVGERGDHSDHGGQGGRSLEAALARLVAKGGAPLVRKSVDLAMRLLGERFVAGRTIGEALAAGGAERARGYTHSYDMLGEAALTAADAARYFTAYQDAIHAIGCAAQGESIHQRPGISVKLSALHPRYGRAQRRRVLDELLPRLAALAQLAKGYGIGLNIDAEEADRLELSLDLFEALVADPQLNGFDGLGFVV